MKKILVIIFSILISFNSYGEWTKVPSSLDRTVYVDFDSIKVNMHIYYWSLADYLKPDQFGDISSLILTELDCKPPRKRRTLSALYYTQPMGKGSPTLTDNKAQEWRHLPRGSSGMDQMKIVCNYAGQLRISVCPAGCSGVVQPPVPASSGQANSSLA
jgi:hypothetical protein